MIIWTGAEGNQEASIILSRAFLSREIKAMDDSLCDELERSRKLRVSLLYYDTSMLMQELLREAGSAPGFCLRMEEITFNFSSQDVAQARSKFLKIP